MERKVVEVEEARGKKVRWWFIGEACAGLPARAAFYQEPEIRRVPKIHAQAQTGTPLEGFLWPLSKRN